MARRIYTDQQIIEGIKRADRVIIVYLTELYGIKVKKLVFSRFNSNLDARDLFQDTFEIVWTKICNGEFPQKDKGNNFDSFFMTIAYRKGVDKVRKIGRFHLEIEERDFLIRIPEPVKKEETDNKRVLRLHNCLKDLSPKFKTILEFFTNDLSHKEIGEKLGFSEAYAKKLRFQALTKLKICMET